MTTINIYYKLHHPHITFGEELIQVEIGAGSPKYENDQEFLASVGKKCLEHQITRYGKDGLANVTTISLFNEYTPGVMRYIPLAVFSIEQVVTFRLVPIGT